MAQTQRTLAVQFGVRAETVANWERGKSNPNVRRAAAVIRYLGYDPTPAGETPGDRFRAVRRRLGLTQREVAARLQLDEGTTGDFERGRRRVSRRVALAVERLLREVGRGEEPRSS